ncbi:MAG: NUDIX hydrolase [Elusimicrobiota bacterium]|jgi:ADP-ribose pyrophosphatase
MTKSFVERRVRKKLVHQGRAVAFRVDTVRMPDGKHATREFLDHWGAVAVVPFLDPKTVVLVRQFRYPVGETTWELPAGKLDKGEKLLSCLERELREETGYTAGRVRPLIAYWPTPAFSNEVIHIYVADRLKPGRMSPDEDEFIEARKVPFKTALRWAQNGKIKDSKTVIALMACAVKGLARAPRDGAKGKRAARA